MAKASTSKRGARKKSAGAGAKKASKAGGKGGGGKTRASRPSDKLSREQKLELHRYMLLTRRLEERLVNLYRQNSVVGGLYRSLGQEGETIGAAYAMGPKDPIAPLIRNMGSLLLRGVAPREIAMQYMARAGSPTGGKDLNVHFGRVREDGLVPPISMLGEMIPITAGIALAAKMKKEDIVPLAFIGDGGTSTGPFYEGMNLIAVWKLPAIVIVENNGYAYSTPMSRQMAVKQIADKGLGLGIQSVTVDGNDILAVYDAVKTARDAAANGEGGTMIEVMTYRRKGHAEHDMQKYVPPGEIEKWAETNDPVDRYHKYLIENGVATQKQLEALDAEVKEFLAGEIDAAMASPMPDGATVLDNVYADLTVPDTLAPYREDA